MSTPPLEDNLFEKKKVDITQTSFTDEELDDEGQTPLPSPAQAPNGSNTKVG